MAQPTPSLLMSRIAAAASLCIASPGGAQTAAPPQTLVITSPAPQQVSGLGDVPLSRAPFSGVNIDAQTLHEIGASRISDALRLDASVSDAYNSPAYWDQLSVRGYVLDNRYNYRREGLPISAETMIPMDNKERIELFKGTSGIQAGTSAPGGLANYVVKRAPSGNDDTLRTVTATHGQGRSSGIALDLGARFGQNKDFGYRLNAAYEDLNPTIRNTRGHRQLLALAMDWRLTPDSRLEWEFEHSERQQIGVNGYSLLGNVLPAPVDGRRNISRQPWSVPGVFEGTTGSLRFRQNLGEGWLWTTSYGAQRLRTDDRLSFAYGCSAENAWDRFCSDGRFDLYDYRSDNERRLSDAFKTEVNGQLDWGGFRHNVGLSLLRQRQLDRMGDMQAYNWAGTGAIDGSANSSAAPTPGDLNTNRSEYSTEIGLHDRMEINRLSALWLGLRHTWLDRSSERTDGSRNVRDQRSLTTPWLALTRQLAEGLTAYGSYGEGVETSVTPNRPGTYLNAGQPLPAQRSQQVEIGLKAQQETSRWQISVFDIRRPLPADACDANGENCLRRLDGLARHRGLELAGGLAHGPWRLDASGAWIDAERQNSEIDPALNGQRPVNVPRVILRAVAQYRWVQVPGLRTSLRIHHEGERRVLEDGRLNLPAWTTLDLAAHYDTRLGGIRTEWTFAIDNLSDQRYWRESPKQFGHYYLYPGAPRSGRITVRTRF